jgi:hypothetical protein
MFLYVFKITFITNNPNLLYCSDKPTWLTVPCPAGASFGYMGIANVGATSGATCAIATDVPTEGFTGGSSYTITVPRTKLVVICWLDCHTNGIYVYICLYRLLGREINIFLPQE